MSHHIQVSEEHTKQTLGKGLIHFGDPGSYIREKLISFNYSLIFENV